MTNHTEKISLYPLLFLTLAIMFIGFIKPIFSSSPVDLTLLLDILLIAFLSHYVFSGKFIISKNVITALVIFISYLFIKTIPEYSLIGIMKFFKISFIGVPIFFSAYVIARNSKTMQLMFNFILYFALIISCAMFIIFVYKSPESRSIFLHGGYQLTGYTIGAAFIYALAIRDQLATSILIIGLAINGCVAATLLSILISFFICIYRRDIHLFLFSLLIPITLILIFSWNVSTLPIVKAIEGKYLGVNSVLVYSEQNTQKNNLNDIPHNFQKSFPSNYASNEASVDRLWMFIDALVKFKEAPFFGHGFGKLNYGLAGYEYPHNILLELLAETGVVGLSIFIFLIVFICFPMQFSLNSTPLISIGIFFMAISLLSGDLSSRFFWFGLGLLYANKKFSACSTKNLRSG